MKKKPKDTRSPEYLFGTGFIADVQLMIGTMMGELGVSRSALANKLGVKEPTITSALDKDSNLTLRTIARIFYALGDEPIFTTKLYEQRAAEGKFYSMVDGPKYDIYMAAVVFPIFEHDTHHIPHAATTTNVLQGFSLPVPSLNHLESSYVINH